jgi:O-methyltransferase
MLIVGGQRYWKFPRLFLLCELSYSGGFAIKGVTMALARAFYKFLKKRKSHMKRFLLLTEVGKNLVPEYRYSWPYMDWYNDEAFNRYLKQFDELGHFNTDRRHMVYQLMRLIEGVSGDTVECGSLEGAGSYLIHLMNERSGKHVRWHHIFDSFEGLSAPEDGDGSHWEKGDLSVSMQEVGSNMGAFDRYSLHKGWIPERFPDVEDKQFAFVHIDVDLFQPTFDTIEFFYPRLNPGGIILCDDYGSSLCPGATRAIDEYLADKPEKMLYMTCGSGFLIKGQETAAQLS